MWTRVTEALPARNADVLVYILDDQEWYVFAAPAPVTHWQALPAPPSLIA